MADLTTDGGSPLLNGGNASSSSGAVPGVDATPSTPTTASDQEAGGITFPTALDIRPSMITPPPSVVTGGSPVDPGIGDANPGAAVGGLFGGNTVGGAASKQNPTDTFTADDTATSATTSGAVTANPPTSDVDTLLNAFAQTLASGGGTTSADTNTPIATVSQSVPSGSTSASGGLSLGIVLALVGIVVSLGAYFIHKHNKAKGGS